MTDERTIEELIEASSFGTPEAVALRATVSDEDARRCVARAGELSAEPVAPRHPYWPDLTDDEGDALSAWFDDTCGDCVEGRCHWGGETSRRSIAAARAGEEFEDATFGRCGCSRHAASVLARPFAAEGDTPHATALLWQSAKDRGEVEVWHE